MSSQGRREVLSMAWPIAVGMLSHTLMSVVDTMLMGKVSTQAQAGVGLSSTLLFALMTFFRGLATGSQSVIAAADGAKDKQRVAEGGGSAICIGAISGVIALILGILLLFFGLQFMTGREVELELASRDYTKWRLIELPISIMGFAFQCALQGLGDTQIRMWAGLVGNAVNIGLDFVLIFGCGPIPRLEATGAAIATLAGTIAITLMYAIRYKKIFGSFTMPSRKLMRNAIQLGMPTAAQSLLNSVSWSAINVVLAWIGSAELAASQIMLNMISVSYLPGFGIGEATGVLVGRRVGAADYSGAARVLKDGRFLTVLFMGGCGVFFAIFGSYIATFFNEDPAVIDVCKKIVMLAAGFQIFDAIDTANLGALRAIGDTKFCLFLLVGAAWFVSLPMTVTLGYCLEWGAQGVWVGFFAETVMLALISGLRVRGLDKGAHVRADLLLGQKTVMPASVTAHITAGPQPIDQD